MLVTVCDLQMQMATPALSFGVPIFALVVIANALFFELTGIGKNLMLCSMRSMPADFTGSHLSELMIGTKWPTQ